MFRLQRGCALRQLFLGHAKFLAKSFFLRLRRLHVLLQFRDLRLARAKVSSELIHVLLCGHISVNRCGDENDRQEKQNPLTSVRLRLDMNIL